MGSLMALSHLTFSDLERSKSRSLRYQSLIFHKEIKLGPILQSTINRKPYIGSPMVSSILTLSDLDKPKQGHFDCEASYFVKELS